MGEGQVPREKGMEPIGAPWVQDLAFPSAPTPPLLPSALCPGPASDPVF